MLNERDSQAVVAAFKRIVQRANHAPLIVFDGQEIMRVLRNVARFRDAVKFTLEMNDLLSHSPVCRELGGIYTVAQYEMNVMLLARVDGAVSVIPDFDPAVKKREQEDGAYLK